MEELSSGGWKGGGKIYERQNISEFENYRVKSAKKGRGISPAFSPVKIAWRLIS
jgi:hypothetical protein